MTDRALLEMAAKAAGLDVVRFNGEFNALECTNLPWFRLYWMPLTNDGDALRLAAKLGLHLSLHGYADVVNGSDDVTIAAHKWAEAVEHHGDDQCAATRRAIVRVAAEIGRRQQ
jgi:hypothetical protein